MLSYIWSENSRLFTIKYLNILRLSGKAEPAIFVTYFNVSGTSSDQWWKINKIMFSKSSLQLIKNDT